jgi:hypothetical protein
VSPYIENPEAIGDPDQTPSFYIGDDPWLMRAVDTNGRIHALREALGGDWRTPLMANDLAGLTYHPERLARVIAVLTAYLPDITGPLPITPRSGK